MKLLKIFLFPFSIIYGVIIYIRNTMYDFGIMKSIELDIPIISMGNISVGGTGKTPHVEYLIRTLIGKHQIGVLSRGYGRRTKGYINAEGNAGGDIIGDEPAQYKSNFPDILVAVGEQRILAIPEMLREDPKPQVILLDDAFQHRAIQPGLSILLTEYHRPFTKDHLLPFGRLREFRSAYKRADILVISKCPPTLSLEERRGIEQQIELLPHQKIFFSSQKYNDLYPIFDRSNVMSLSKELDVLLLCGIADTKYINNYIKEQARSVKLMKFSDHHYFSEEDLQKVQLKFDEIKSDHKIIITTEKDAMRLALHRNWILQNELPIYCLPVEVKFLNEDEELFITNVKDFISAFSADYRIR